MSAASRREPQEEILEAALASLTDADIPPADDELYGWPDPDFDRPAALAGLDGAELEELAADASVPATPGWPLSFQAPTGPEAWPAGFGPRDRIRGRARVRRWRSARRSGRGAAAGRVRRRHA